MRLFLNSSDTVDNNSLGNKIDIPLEQSSINSNNQEISISVVKCTLPQTISNLATRRVYDGVQQSPTLNWRYTTVFPPVYTDYKIYLNNQYGEGTPATRMNFNLQTTINDVLKKMNDLMGVEAIKIDDTLQNIGFKRLIAVGSAGIVLDFPRYLCKGFGLYHDGTTVELDQDVFTPYDYDLSAIFRNCYIKTKSSLDSFNSARLTSQTNTLAQIPLGIGYNVESDDTLATKQTPGSTTFLMKNRNLIIYDNHDYIGSHKNIHSDVLDRVHLELVDENGFPVYLGGGLFNIELDVKIINNQTNLTQRLYLHSEDASVDPPDPTKEANQADVIFNLENANINIANNRNNKQLAISLLKCTIPNTINYLRTNEDTSYPIVKYSSSESGESYGIVLYVTRKTFVLPEYSAARTTDVEIYVPVTLLQDARDIVNILNLGIEAMTSSPPSSMLTVNEHTHYLESFGTATFSFLNSYFVKNQTYDIADRIKYNVQNLIFYRLLGININSDLTLQATVICTEDLSLEKNRTIKYPVNAVDRNIYLKTSLTTNTFTSNDNSNTVLASIPLSVAVQNSYSTSTIVGSETITSRISEKFISYENKQIQDSHKIVTNDNISELRCQLVWADGTKIYSFSNINYEFEIKYIQS